MDIRNCKKCGKPFTYLGNHLCPDCIELEEEEFKTVKEYIYDHPRCTPQEVSEETGVPFKTIIKFLKEDRLEAVEGLSDLLKCERCDAPIKSGRYCPDCLAKLQRDTKKLLNESESTVAKIEENYGTSSKIYVDALRNRNSKPEKS